MISINFNPFFLSTQRSINTSGKFIEQAIQRMSSGCKINKAADDPAGFYIASSLSSDIRGLSVAQQNISSGINFLNTAYSSLTQMNNILDRLNDLALQGSSSSMDSSTRDSLQREADLLLDELFRLRDDSSFNGINVFGVDKQTSFAERLAKAASISSSAGEALSSYSPPPRKLVCRS